MITAAAVSAVREKGARLLWLITHWCNYKCDFCGVDVYSRKSSKGIPQRHAFDYYTPLEWLAAFDRQFPTKELNLTMTGGEPFIDRTNFLPLLDGLSRRENIHVNIHTNGSWNPDYFAGIDQSRVSLEISFHASQTAFEPFRQRLLRIRDNGFNVTNVHAVLAPEHLDDAETFMTVLRADGFYPALAGMQATGLYQDSYERTERQAELLEKYADPRNVYFTILDPPTLGLDCYHPSVSYRMMHDATIGIDCYNEFPANFVTGELPELPGYPVACPRDICGGCPEMTRSIPSLDINHGHVPSLLNSPTFSQDYVDFVHRREANPNALADELKQLTVPGEGNAYDLFRERLRARRKTPVAFDVPLDAITQPVPPIPAFGYLDKHHGEVYKARATDRIWLSGWAASTRTEAPVSEVRVFAGDLLCGTFRNFYPRPEVATLFNRKDFLETGYRGLVFVPMLKPGTYPLTAVALDSTGLETHLHSLAIEITE